MVATHEPDRHHALLMALVMFDPARWSGKPREAEVFRAWLRARLEDPEIPPDAAGAAPTT